MGDRLNYLSFFGSGMAALMFLLSLILSQATVAFHVASGIGGTAILYVSVTHFFWRCTGFDIVGACATLKSYSDKLDGETNNWESLGDTQHTFCMPMAESFFPTGCNLVRSFYILGILLILTAVINWMAMAIAVALRYDYLKTRKYKERMVACTIDVIGGGTMLLWAVIYLTMILVNAQDSGGINALSVGEGIPLGWGWGCLLVGGMFQLGVGALAWFIQVSAEEVVEDIWPVKKLAKEIAMTDMAYARMGLMGAAGGAAPGLGGTHAVVPAGAPGGVAPTTGGMATAPGVMMVPVPPGTVMPPGTVLPPGGLVMAGAAPPGTVLPPGTVMPPGVVMPAAPDAGMPPLRPAF